MGLKGKIKADHIPLNKMELVVPGMPTLTVITSDELEEAIQAVDLPDRTKASGGNAEPVEFSIEIPMHHSDEIQAMDLWFRAAKDPVLPTYKRPATLRWPSISGKSRKSYTLTGVWVMTRTIPGGDMTNEGEEANVSYALSADEVLAVGL